MTIASRRSARALVPVALALITLVASTSAGAQAPAPADASAMHALVGRWGCAGAFASGKPIASTLTVESSLGGQWLEYHQDDLPPNRYHAIGTIGVDRASSLPVMVVHDTFGSVRFFTSAAPWTGGALSVETAPTPAATPPARRERFIYTAGRDTLRVRYEVSRVPGTWQMGDTLTCVRH